MRACSSPATRLTAARSASVSGRIRAPIQIGWSMLSPQLRQITFAVSDMRAIVE